MPTLNDLLAKGYFPRELPPPFTTSLFSGAVGGPGGIPGAFTGSTPKHATLCVHNMVRTGGLRRHLGIPNPVQFLRLCQFVVARWTDLQTLAAASPFSLTKPIGTDPSRALTPEHTLDDRTLKRVELRSRAKFILRTDVNRFYPSVYTHSIPWAIHGKTAVKTAMATGTFNRKPAFWADELDTLARGVNANQTMGIPIGPDSSLLLAEVVLGAVDKELISRLPRLRGIRFIDDYEFSASQRSEAEETASVLQSILSQYELALNPSKTRIIELPDTLEPLWTSHLRTFLFRFGGIKGQKNDLTAYFDRVFDFAKKEPDEGILKYAIARLNGVEVEPANWPLYESILSHSALVEPACLPQVVGQITHYRSRGLALDTGMWTECLNQIVLERLPLGQASEAVWAMWLMKISGVPLHPKCAQAVDNCDDSAAALMALGLASVGLAPGATFTRLNSFAERDELFGSQWLLCYEGNHRGWIKPPSGNPSLSTNPQFDSLHKAGVSFFDIAANPPTPRRTTFVTGGGGGGGGGGPYPI